MRSGVCDWVNRDSLSVGVVMSDLLIARLFDLTVLSIKRGLPALAADYARQLARAANGTFIHTFSSH